MMTQDGAGYGRANGFGYTPGATELPWWRTIGVDPVAASRLLYDRATEAGGVVAGDVLASAAGGLREEAAALGETAGAAASAEVRREVEAGVRAQANRAILIGGLVGAAVIGAGLLGYWYLSR